jgi:hypothetical protein
MRKAQFIETHVSTGSDFIFFCLYCSLWRILESVFGISSRYGILFVLRYRIIYRIEKRSSLRLVLNPSSEFGLQKAKFPWKSSLVCSIWWLRSLGSLYRLWEVTYDVANPKSISFSWHFGSIRSGRPTHMLSSFRSL